MAEHTLRNENMKNPTAILKMVGDIERMSGFPYPYQEKEADDKVPPVQKEQTSRRRQVVVCFSRADDSIQASAFT